MKSKRVLITGAGSGIGSEIALAFGKQGYDVVIGYQSSVKGAEETLSRIKEFGGTGITVRIDVKDEDSTKETLKVISGDMPITVLINNAGIVKDSYLRFMSLSVWQEVIDVNLTGAFICGKILLPGMLKAKWGRIINISSVAAFTGDIQRANYAASKAGLLGLTHSLSREVASSGITVNAIAPGMIETHLLSGINAEKRSALTAQIPQKKFGTAKDVASLALFLASEDAGYITGQTINVDGGLYMS